MDSDSMGRLFEYVKLHQPNRKVRYFHLANDDAEIIEILINFFPRKKFKSFVIKPTEKLQL